MGPTQLGNLKIVSPIWHVVPTTITSAHVVHGVNGSGPDDEAVRTIELNAKRNGVGVGHSRVGVL